MRKLSLLMSVILVLFAVPVYSTPVFFNEIHYDNTGADVDEAIEIAGPAGTDLTGWSIILYNGSGGSVYRTFNLNGSIPELQNGFGVLPFAIAGIQNGSPDGLALWNGTGLVQFLSYEGSFTAVGGVADGLTSVDIGVAQSGNTPVGDSLQLTGTGNEYEDFVWTSAGPQSMDLINTAQNFQAIQGSNPVPEPTTMLLLGTGILGLAVLKHHKLFKKS